MLRTLHYQVISKSPTRRRACLSSVEHPQLASNSMAIRERGGGGGGGGGERGRGSKKYRRESVYNKGVIISQL